MISEKLTEEFIDKHYFILDKSFSIEEYDCNGFSTDYWIDLEAGTEWEITDDDYIGGDIHLDGLSDGCGCGWIEISEDTFRSLFSAHEWIPRKE